MQEVDAVIVLFGKKEDTLKLVDSFNYFKEKEIIDLEKYEINGFPNFRKTKDKYYAYLAQQDIRNKINSALKNNQIPVLINGNNEVLQVSLFSYYLNNLKPFYEHLTEKSELIKQSCVLFNLYYYEPEEITVEEIKKGLTDIEKERHKKNKDVSPIYKTIYLGIGDIEDKENIRHFDVDEDLEKNITSYLVDELNKCYFCKSYYQEKIDPFGDFPSNIVNSYCSYGKTPNTRIIDRTKIKKIGCPKRY